MGGGSDTNITNTGLGDDQFANLSAGQSSINSNINATRDGANARFDSVDGTLSGIRGDISGVGTNLSSGFTNLRGLMGQNMEANQQGFTGVTNSIDQSTGQIQSGMQTGFDGVNQNLTTGFGTMDDTMDERFNRVDTAQQTAQTAIDTGFQDTTNNFSDLNTRLTDDFNNAQNTLDTGFADVGQGLNDLDTNTQNRLDTVQGNVLTGQAALGQDVDRMSDTQDIYYGDLSNRQMEIQQGQDDFRSNFDDYVQRYSEDTTLANQTRADLQQGMVSEVGRIRTDIGTVAQAQEQRADAQQGFMSRQFSSLVSQMAPETLVRNRDVARMASQDERVAPQVRQDLFMVGQSFDDNGNLINNSIDGMGNTVSRNIDDTGILNIRTFDSAGQVSGERGIDLLRTFDTLESLQNQSALPPA